MGGLGAFFEVRMCFCVAGARNSAPCQKWAKREGLVAFPKPMAGVWHLKRIWKDAVRMAGAVQETCSLDLLGGQGADFREGLRFGGAYLQVCQDDVAWHVQHFVWPGITFSGQAQQHTQVEWQEMIGTRPIRGRQLCTQLSIFEGSHADLLRFWCCQLRKLRKSRNVASFLTLSSCTIEEISRNCFVFDVVKFKNWGGLAG